MFKVILVLITALFFTNQASAADVTIGSGVMTERYATDRNVYFQSTAIDPPPFGDNGSCANHFEGLLKSENKVQAETTSMDVFGTVGRKLIYKCTTKTSGT